MAYVPGTEIEKPSLDLTGVEVSFTKVKKAVRELRRAGVPENIIQTFCESAAGGEGMMFSNLDATLADYLELV